MPDLYGEFCGVCENCGHHFPLEYEWYLKNLFDRDSIREFNTEIRSLNPLNYEGLDKKLKQARSKTGRNCANITFEAKVMGLDVVVTMLYSDFRNGTVGAAEGEKFVLACELAKLQKTAALGLRPHHRRHPHPGRHPGGDPDAQMHHGGARIHRCRRPLYRGLRQQLLCRAGGQLPRLFPLPVRHPLQPAGLRRPAGHPRHHRPGIPPDYHSAKNALRRGHIQGIWDRREFRRNLHKCLLTMGSSKLYYR